MSAEFLRGAGQRVRLFSARKHTASTRSARSRRCTTGRSRCSSAWAATSWRATPDTQLHRARRSQRCRAHGADLDQAQPRAPDHRRAGADPALPRAHRARRAGLGRAVRQRRRHRRASCTSRAACCRRRRSSCGASRRSSRGMAHSGRSRDARPRIGSGLVADYDRIREHIEHVVPGFAQYNRRVREPGGFYLPNGPREGKFTTPSGKAQFTVHPIPRARSAAGRAAADDRPQPRSVQHHDLRRERSLPRDLERAPRGLHQRRGHRERRPSDARARST